MFAQPDSSGDWMPLAVGNKWQYLVDMERINTITIDELIKKDTLNYYRFNYGTIYRYDNEILYKKLSENSDEIIIDFSRPAGYQYNTSPFYSNTIIEGNVALFDSLRFYKGNSYFWIYGSGEERYARNIGNYYGHDGGHVSGGHTYSSTKILIQAVIYFDSFDSLVFSHNHSPAIIFSPVTKISNPGFSLNLNVTHNYSTNEFNFIDSVIMYSNYRKDSNVINNPPVLAVYNPATSTNYNVNLLLDTMLLKNGYSFNYRFTAKDKSLIPKYGYAPVTGYYSAILDTLTGMKQIQLFSYSLEQNYPNPFNPFTIIRYQLPEKSFITIKVYDILGKEIALLVNEEKKSGDYSIEFDGSEFSSGVYFYSIKTNAFFAVKKMILAK
jgi:hypothetical protein